MIRVITWSPDQHRCARPIGCREPEAAYQIPDQFSGRRIKAVVQIHNLIPGLLWDGDDAGGFFPIFPLTFPGDLYAFITRGRRTAAQFFKHLFCGLRQSRRLTHPVCVERNQEPIPFSRRRPQHCLADEFCDQGQSVAFVASGRQYCTPLK